MSPAVYLDRSFNSPPANKYSSWHPHVYGTKVFTPHRISDILGWSSSLSETDEPMDDSVVDEKPLDLTLHHHHDRDDKEDVFDKNYNFISSNSGDKNNKLDVAGNFLVNGNSKECPSAFYPIDSYNHRKLQHHQHQPKQKRDSPNNPLHQELNSSGSGNTNSATTASRSRISSSATATTNKSTSKKNTPATAITATTISGTGNILRGKQSLTMFCFL